MGIKPDGTIDKKFNPNAIVDRAQFGTILSRLIWGTTYDYDGEIPYYFLHFQALKMVNIMTNTTQPYKAELR